LHWNITHQARLQSAAAAAAAPLPVEREAWTPAAAPPPAPPPQPRPPPPLAAAPVAAPTLGLLPPALLAQHPPYTATRAGISAEERTRRFTARALALAGEGGPGGAGSSLLSPPIPAAGDAQRSPAWHAARSGRLTASAFGNALGFWSGGRTGLWEEKVGLGTPFAGNAATAYGTAAEAPALAAYAAATGLPVTDCAFAVLKPDPAHDWLGASPDGLVPAAGEVPGPGGASPGLAPPPPCPPAPGAAAALAAAAAAGGPGILEIKCPFNRGSPGDGLPWGSMSSSGAYDKRGGAYSASTPRPPPFYYMPQVQGLMAIFGRSWCHLWCWTPVHGASLYTIPADPAYWAGAYEVLADLWWRHVTPARLAAADAAAAAGCGDPAGLLTPGGLVLPSGGGLAAPSPAQLAARAAVEAYRPADHHPLTRELEAASKAMAAAAAADAAWFASGPRPGAGSGLA